jgi:hypothetical protein
MRLPRVKTWDGRSSTLSWSATGIPVERQVPGAFAN